MTSTRNPTQTIHNREFWTDFFLLYENLPALWDMRSSLYKERNAKLEAYDIMVGKLREIEPNADREDVLRKINIFRTNYRRERTRIKLSQMTRRSYKTTLWYYELLSFLETQETRKDNKRSNTSHDNDKSILRKKQRKTKLVPYEMKNGRTLNQLEIAQETEAYNEQENIETVDNEEIHYEYMTENTAASPQYSQHENVHEDTCNMEEEDDSNSAEHFQHQHPQQQHQFQKQFQTFSLQHIPTNHPKAEIDEEQEEEEEFYEEHEAEMFVHLLREQEDTHEIVEEIITDEQVQSPQQHGEGEENKSVDFKSKHHHTIANKKMRLVANSRKIMPKKMLQPIIAGKRTVKGAGGGGGGVTSEAAEILAKSWAVQYDEMPADQKVFARKAIADILFEGCMGNLGREHEHHVADSAVTVMGSSAHNNKVTTAQMQSGAEEGDDHYAAVDHGDHSKLSDWIKLN